MATISTTARPAYVYDAGGDQWVPIAWTVLGSGAASAPALTFTGDSNTGLWSPGADIVSLATGGVERFRINSAGTAMIGDVSRNTVYVTSSFTPGFQSAVGTGTGGFYRYTTDADGPALVFSKSRNATAGSHTVVNSGDTVGYIGFAGSDGTAFRTAATIFAQVDGTPGASDMPGRLIFTTTADGSATPTERMRIDSSGNVGIGTSSPTAALHVSKADTSLAVLFNGTTRGVRVGHSSTASVIEGVDQTGTGSYQPLAVGGSEVQFTTSGTERMRVDNAGLITGTGTSLGAWTAYTPTLGGTGWAIGNGTATGAYCQVGKLVFFRAEITFGSTSTFGAAAAPTITGPVNAKSGINGNHNLMVNLLDTSTSAEYFAWCRTTASSPLTVVISYLGTSSQRTDINSTAPFTWATGDRIQLTGFYEAS